MKTSSLTSTNPPTAVRMPRKISVSFKRFLGLFELARRFAQRGGGRRALGRIDGLGGRAAERLALRPELLLRLGPPLPDIARGQLVLAREPLHRRPFRRHAVGALDRRQL